MNVQSVERTFIDKIFAICDYRLHDMQVRDSRHIYDIAKLIDCINFDNSFKNLVLRVRDDRANLKNNLSAQPKYDIPDLLQDIIDTRFFEADYNRLTSKLLYEEYSYDKAITNAISKVIESMAF